MSDATVVVIDDLTDEQIEELRKEVEREEAERAARLDMLGVSIAGLRSEAIEARASSGIEDEWREDEEFYEGIDERNRTENKAWQSKPPGRVEASPTGNGSTLFLNITGQYCDSAAASLADMLLPTDDSAWSIKPTPVPSMVAIADGDIPDNVNEALLAAAGGDPVAANEKATEVVKQARAEIEKAREASEAAEKRIKDWHVECQLTSGLRKVIEDSSRIGSGVIKGPIPESVTRAAYKNNELIQEQYIQPVSRAISPWSLFPAAGCGESIHDGSYIFERDYISAKRLKQLIEGDRHGYIESQVLQVIEEGPSEATKEAPSSPDINTQQEKKDKLFEIWYFYGEIPAKDLEAAGCECDEDVANAHIVMVNNRVIKAVVNPLDDGEFPYDVMVWKRRAGMPWGTGVARLIRTAQRVINGAARNLMDNAGLSGGPMWAYNPGLISPIDGQPELAPRKGWIANEDADVSDIKSAFTFFSMDMRVNELMAIIQLGMKFAEDVTGLPMIIQGQMGASSPDTLGQTEILNNNASTVRRRIARLFDDLVTEPHVRRYYRYLLEYGENDDEKGDFTIDASGSSGLVERDIQKRQIIDLGRFAINPVYGIDPKKWSREYLKAEKFDIEMFEYDDEEWRKVVEAMSQPGANDPRMQIAQMKMQADMQQAQMKAQLETDKLLQKDEAQAREHEHELQIASMEQAFEEEMQRLKMAGVKDNILDESKVRINETVMRLRTQKELAGIRQVARPEVEPIGRAPPGQAFER